MNDRSGPKAASAEVVTTTLASIAPHATDRPTHHRRTFARRDLQRRRRRMVAQHELSELLLELYPPDDREPSDYGLTGDELRAEANRLVRSGWRRDEVLARLTVPR